MQTQQPAAWRAAMSATNSEYTAARAKQHAADVRGKFFPKAQGRAPLKPEPTVPVVCELVEKPPLPRIKIAEGVSTEDLVAKVLCNRITLESIFRSVCEEFDISRKDFNGVRRARRLVRPRQVASYLAKRLTDRSYPEIGRKIGGRDHTTILHGERRIEELMERDAELRAKVERLTALLQKKTSPGA